MQKLQFPDGRNLSSGPLFLYFACSLLFSVTFCSNAIGFQEVNSSEKLELILKEKIPDLTKVQKLLDHAGVLDRNRDTTMLNYAREALRLSVRNKYLKETARSHYVMGSGFNLVSNWDSAQYHTEKCIMLSQEIGYHLYQAVGNNLMGSIISKKGDRAAGLIYFSKALPLFEVAGNRSGVGAALNRIGNFYIGIGEYDQALENHHQALRIFEELDRSDQINNVINNIGVSYFFLEDWDRALFYFKRALKEIEQTGSNASIASRVLNVGKVYVETGQYEQAIPFLQRALEHARTFKGRKIECRVYLQLGIIAMANEHPEVALEYFRKGLKIATALKTKDVEKNLYKNMAQLFAEANQMDSAYFFEVKYHFLKDHLTSSQYSDRVLVLKNLFEVTEKEKEIVLLANRNETKDLWIYGVVITLVLFVSLFGLFFVNYRSKQYRLRMLHEHEEQVSRQKVADVLKDQEINNFKSRLEGQEEERKRVAKELHDGIGGALAGIKMNLAHLIKNGVEKEQDIRQIADSLDFVYEEVRTVSHNLLPPSFTDSSFTDVLEQFFLEYDTMQQVKLNFEFFPKKMLNMISLDIQIEIYRIIQELMTNIQKHANATEVNLSLVLHETYLSLLLEDDGVGFDSSSIKGGIGMKNLYARVNNLSGKILIDSRPGIGTSVDLNVPINTN